MDFILFSGCKKTNGRLLEKIKGISANKEQLIANLRSLNIFSTVDDAARNARKTQIALAEKANSVHLRMKSDGKKSLTLAFPNIFGNAESLCVDYNSLDETVVKLSKPSVISGQIVRSALTAQAETRTYNEKKVVIRRAMLSSEWGRKSLNLGIESVKQLQVFFAGGSYNFLGFDLVGKLGFSQGSGVEKVVADKTPFFKASLQRNFEMAFGRFFMSSQLGIGRLFGATSLTEKFFLGPEVRGYRAMAISPVAHGKKVGGNSFATIRSQIGVNLCALRLFAFADAGVTSTHGLRQCYEIANKFGDSGCIGKSVGFGVSLKDKKGCSFVYSVPLTNNQETESYSLGIDMQF